ncbi:chromosome segregation ATPase [Antribacter gilvus]|uniref:chromosome segregation ATPase n=1 Tax=Antribacter gilvus TaxID=2304675 RepID=UPI000F7783EE|nr:chromosome segregation ATPase [Antribacter gilvus]
MWLRINRKAPYLNLRWSHSLHVPHGATEYERAAGVNALWDALPRSNGRDDFHANRISEVLYGRHVRCVSFLSTSVRSSAAANLLAQPLNELKPRQIFDAIATLTGLARDLEAEQAHRSKEHRHRTRAREAQEDLERWQMETAVVEAGIAKRAQARTWLDLARDSWRARCARHLHDGVVRAEEIGPEVEALEEQAAELESTVETIEQELAGLSDDEEFDRKARAAEELYKRLDKRDRELESDQGAARLRLEELAHDHRTLSEQSRASDGRSLEQARDEESTARLAVEDAVGEQTLAGVAVTDAQKHLAAAEAGEDIATEALATLRESGITAAALVDVVHLGTDERTVWEPRLVPYRNAVVVLRADEKRALGLLTGRAAVVLVAADAPGSVRTGAGSSVPGSVDLRFDLTTFLAVLANRAGGQPAHVDDDAGVHVPGQFPVPVTGRAARIVAARDDHKTKIRLRDEADRLLEVERGKLKRAEERTAGARAAEHAASVLAEMERLRAANQKRVEEQDQQRPALDEATEAWDRVRSARETRETLIKNHRDTKNRVTGEIKDKRRAKETLEGELVGLDLPAREALFGDSPQAAERLLLSLDEDQARRSIAEWNETACSELQEAVRRCFPEDAPEEEMPAEIRELLIEQRWRVGRLEVRIGLFPSMHRALRTHLKQTEEYDQHQKAQIDQQRSQRSSDLRAALEGLSEAELTSRTHRASVAQGIKTTLKKVAEEFDRLDLRYGGYGADLDFPEPEPPAEPDQPWQWTVTPRWRRAEGQRMSGYDLRSNTAQLDEKAVKLVCAAALAGGGDRPLLLILDELGRNLGKQHRREAVALFEQIGNDRNITVVGALQDDMERYAIEASGLYVKLRRRSDSMPYNEAPVVVGDETNRSRVEMLQAWLTSYRQADEATLEEVVA